jgi:hypothetical protein
MDTLARESMAMISFELSDEPVEDTIEVEVDGTINTDWSYDDTSNSVVFSVAPSDGSAIDVTYAVWAECYDDTGSP